MSHAVVEIPRLRERVAPGLPGVAPPRWVTDAEFDIGRHVRQIALPGKRTDRDLLDEAARIFSEPFDRTRPLWSFTAIEKLSRGRSGLIVKLHHSISDGIGAIRLAELYMDIEADPGPPPDVDLTEIIEDALATNPPPKDFRETAAKSLAHLSRRHLGQARRAAAELSLWDADRGRAKAAIGQTLNTASTIANQAGLGSPGERKPPSPLWRQRSRHRRLETLTIDLDNALTRSRELGGKLNDLFVTGAVDAAARYHAARDSDVDGFNVSFVVSTRSDTAAGGNSFAPVTLRLASRADDATDLYTQTRDAMETKRLAAQRASSGSTEMLAGIAATLPTAVLTRAGRRRSGQQDFATSNLRASPIPLYIAGARIADLFPVGPVAGTAFNLTAMSYDGRLQMTLHVDPIAVDAPGELRDLLAAAYADLLNT